MNKLDPIFVKKYVEDCGYILLSEYKRNRDKLLMKCPKGHIIEMYWGAFKDDHRCKQCYYDSLEGIKRKPFSKQHKKRISESKKGTKHSEEHKRKISESLKGKKNPFYGKKHSEETKKRMSDKKKKYVGENHPFFGKTILMKQKEKLEKHIKEK